MAAALRKKGVPLIMVADRAQAEIVIERHSGQEGCGKGQEVASRRLPSFDLSLPNGDESPHGVIACADASDRASPNKGLRSSAEKLAKYLKRKMVDDEKKFVRMVPTVAVVK